MSAGFEEALDSSYVEVKMDNYPGESKLMAVPEGVDHRVFRHVLAACYSAYLAAGHVPTLEEIHEYWPRISIDSYAEVLSRPEFVDAMAVRGVDWGDSGGLSYTQSLTIDKLSNALDKRSDEAKLRELGISSVQLTAWKRNPLFMRVYEQRATSNIKDHMPSILNRVVGKAEAGSLDAAKMILAIDGRFDPQNREVANLTQLVQELIRIVQIRVQDPAVREQIAADLSVAAAKVGSIEATKLV